MEDKISVHISMTTDEWWLIYRAVDTFKRQEAWQAINPEEVQKELEDILNKIKIIPGVFETVYTER